MAMKCIWLSRDYQFVGRYAKPNIFKIERVTPLPQIRFWYWTSMLWLFDSCQNKVSIDQYHVAMAQIMCGT